MYKHIQHLHAPSCTFRVFPHCQGWCQDLITGQNRSRVIRVQSLVIWWWGSPFFEPYPGYPRIFFHVNIPFWGAWLCAIYIYMIMANCKWCCSLQTAEFQGPRLQSPPRWWYLARVFWSHSQLHDYQPRHFSGATPIPSGSAIAKAPVIHAASQVSSRQLGNAKATRLMSRCATGVTDVTGATMLPGQVIAESLGIGYPLVN